MVDNNTALLSVIRPLMEKARVPGVAVGIVNDGVEEVAALGVTSVDNPLDVTPDTLFQVGSVTKTITATACMALCSLGRLDLDVPVRTYVRNLRMSDPDVTDRVTLRQLLTHSAGFFGDAFVDTGSGDDALSKAVAEMAALEQLTPLGSVRSYCNSGFALVGRVIELVTGSTFEAAIRRLVFEPLDMTMSFFSADEVITHRFVVGHIWDWEREQMLVGSPWSLTRATHPAGGVISTVRDLMRYAHYHLSSDVAVELMREPQPPVTGMVAAKGVSWSLREAGGELVVEHGGGTHGQTCMLALVPSRRFAIAVLTNSSRGSEVFGEVISYAFRRYLQLESPDPNPIEVDPIALRELKGRYQGQLADYCMAVDNDELVVATRPKAGFPLSDTPPAPTPPPIHLRFIAPDRLVMWDGPSRGGFVDVLRDAMGHVEWLRIGGRICRYQSDL